MQILQWGQNPWDQEILVRISWDLLWAAIVAGVLFVVAHGIYVRWWAPRTTAPLDAHDSAAGAATANTPERIVRHPLGARLFHWGMSIAMFALLVTGFLPVVGIQFAWVTIHWIAGLVLVGAVAVHIVHVYVWQDFWSMQITRADTRDARSRVRRALGGQAPPPGKPGKYPLENKFYHHIVALMTAVVMGTGLLMMARVPTPLWERNPYLLSDVNWGIVYVLHGASSVALVTLILVHVYFAIRPEKRWLTVSMLAGWVGRADYLRHHDPQRWVVAAEATPRRTGAE